MVSFIPRELLVGVVDLLEQRLEPEADVRARPAKLAKRAAHGARFSPEDRVGEQPGHDARPTLMLLTLTS